MAASRWALTSDLTRLVVCGDPASVLALFVILSCDNSCIHLCQQYEAFLDRCGYGWASWFRAEGWESIEDCYDAHWEAEESQQATCETQAVDWSERGCDEVSAYAE